MEKFFNLGFIGESNFYRSQLSENKCIAIIVSSDEEKDYQTGQNRDMQFMITDLEDLNPVLNTIAQVPLPIPPTVAVPTFQPLQGLDSAYDPLLPNINALPAMEPVWPLSHYYEDITLTDDDEETEEKRDKYTPECEDISEPEKDRSVPQV